MFQLTKGSLKKILDGETITDPLLQILQMKNIQNNQDGIVRYKVSLYDGDSQHTFGILATQQNHLVENNELKIGSVIRLEEYAANVLSKDPPKVVVILLNFKILGEMDTKTGSSSSSEVAAKPVQNENIEPEESKTKITTSNAKKFFNTKETVSANPKSNSSKIVDSSANNNSTQSGMFNGFKIFTIASLNPYQNKWSIKARCSNKTPIRTWSNARGDGKLFSADFIDTSGEIKATGFQEQCEKFYDMITVDNVYFISRGTLKTANKQYSKINNDYEMTFTSETVIEPCEEADNLPHINICLCPLSEVNNKNVNDLVDVIGVVKSTSDVTTITVKSTGKELAKREICIVDDSNCAINVTLWGSQAQDFDGSENPVILFKGAKVGDYNGKNLSVGGGAVVQINPDIPESHKLRGWFDQGGSESTFQELSNTAQVGGGSTLPANWKHLGSLKSENLGMQDKPDYITCKAIVLFCKKDNSMYMACPADACNKKVVDQNDGEYRCEKCNKSYDKFKWRFVMSANIADYTDSSWITSFQDSSELILGISADDLGQLKNTDSNKYDETFSESAFREFNFKLRIKSETYNDEQRVKVGVTTCEPVNYAANGKLLLQKIKAFAKNA